MEISVREHRAEAARDVAGPVRGDFKSSVASALHSGPTKFICRLPALFRCCPRAVSGAKHSWRGIAPSREPMTIKRSGSFLSSAVGPDHGPRIGLVFGIEPRSHFDWQLAILFDWLAGQADDRRQKETS